LPTFSTARLRAFLNLGRPAGLPTVWSNCLAGWWLGGGRNLDNLPFLFVSVTFIHLGGGFLNDAFDAEFDKEKHRERPIPSGTLSWLVVWRCGLGLLAAGTLLLFGPGRLPATLGLALVVCVVFYNALHRLIALSPVLLGACRLLFYVLAASTAVRGVTGWSIWCGLAMAAYVTGAGFYRPRPITPETSPAVSFWPVCLLAVPSALALVMDTGEYRQGGLLLSAILGLWILRSIRRTHWSPKPELAFTYAGLQAGIVFADWLAVANAPRELSAVFLVLFGITLVLQRLVPAH
jgi:4-hydroxybenzoate polyprenyltransferase